MVAAVCFDLDGTLIRSEEIRDAVRRDYVTEAGGRWSPVAQREMTGMHLAEWARYMHDRLGVLRSPLEIASEIEGRIETIYRAGIPLVPGARDVLERCAAIWPLALATGSTRRLIDLVLDLGALRPYFRATVSVDDVARGKPAPDIYVLAAERLGVDPVRCVAVEDSASGVRSARAAGMRVIAIAGTGDPAGLFLPRTDATVARLADVTPELVRSAANGRGALG
jgi:HAD superfamily hydrolase (TIGR01509 family)